MHRLPSQSRWPRLAAIVGLLTVLLFQPTGPAPKVAADDLFATFDISGASLQGTYFLRNFKSTESATQPWTLQGSHLRVYRATSAAGTLVFNASLLANTVARTSQPS